MNYFFLSFPTFLFPKGDISKFFNFLFPPASKAKFLELQIKTFFKRIKFYVLQSSFPTSFQKARITTGSTNCSREMQKRKKQKRKKIWIDILKFRIFFSHQLLKGSDAKAKKKNE